MITGPKYKIARRLGAPIFEKTQTQKYALHLERRSKKRGFLKPKTEFGIQFNEKQKARFSYGLSEKQFSNYVKEALAKKTPHTPEIIFQFLERRLDNVVYRLGIAPTRAGARQIVSHGHVLVNNRRNNVPSHRVYVGDIISIRPGSLSKGLFSNNFSKNDLASPSWLRLDKQTHSAEVVGEPVLVASEQMFDLKSVVEFYSR